MTDAKENTLVNKATAFGMVLAKKEENESGELGAFTHLNKTSLVLDSRVFNETPLSTKRCNALLNKLLFTVYNGETFNANDATAIFFNVIKTFQSKEMSLRRLMYVSIKEVQLNKLMSIVGAVCAGYHDGDEQSDSGH